MKIGFFTDSYSPLTDGVATSVEASAKALKKLGHEVYIIAPRYPEQKIKEKDIYRLTSVKFIRASDARLAISIPEKSLLDILRLDFDIIHGHSGGGVTFIGLQIAKARNIPYIATYHTLWNRYTHYFLRGQVIKPRMIEVTSRLFGNFCDSLIAPTQRVKKELIKYGVRKPIIVLPNGVNVESFQNAPVGFLRKKIKVNGRKKVLLYAGRLGKEKSVDFLIRSFKLITDEKPDVCLVIAGSGPEKKNLEKLTKSLRIENNVFFIGAVKNSSMPKIYVDADLFVFASRTETQGMVILEAFASGLPVVAVSDLAFKGIIENDKNGFLVREKYKDFADKIIKVLNNEKKYKKFSKNAKKTANQFSSDITAEKLEKIYIKLVTEHDKKSRTKITTRYLKSFVRRIREQIKSY